MIKYNFSDFRGSYANLNGEHTVNISRLDIARAFIVTGQNTWGSVFSLGIWRIGELFCKAMAYTEKDSSNNLKLTQNFYSLNQSEKTPISYYFGQGLTKLMAEKYLNVKWLFHLDNYANQITFLNNSNFTPKKVIKAINKKPQRPDLIGLESSNRVHIFESKGYSSGFNKGVFQHAINQVSIVQSYNNVVPLTKNACFFLLNKIPIEGKIVDPEMHENIAIEFDEIEALSVYYSFFTENQAHFEEEFSIREHTFKIAPINIEDYKIGIDIRILGGFYDANLELYDKETWNAINENENLSIGLDGIIVLRN